LRRHAGWFLSPPDEPNGRNGEEGSRTRRSNDYRECSGGTRRLGGNDYGGRHTQASDGSPQQHTGPHEVEQVLGLGRWHDRVRPKVDLLRGDLEIRLRR
jgi:hypothetical protein